jgi:hypothetical protein
MEFKGKDNCEEVRYSPTAIDVAGFSTTICRELAVECAKLFDGHLRSIVLTGSLARNEATFRKEGDGWGLLGDVDCLLVLRKGAEVPRALEVDSLGKAIEARLLGLGIRAHVGLNMVRPSYFRALPRRIFTFELRSFGRVIWGDPEILALIPQFPPERISREDAWRILCHRIIELLACLEEVQFPIEPVDPALCYAIVKLYLDMATSYLVFLGQYAPTYSERELRLRLLAETDGAARNSPFSLKEFSRRVSECTAWKLRGPGKNDQTPCGLLEEAIGYGRLLWLWEADQLTSCERSLTVGAICESVARRQTMEQRLRGWISASRRTDWSRTWRDLPRWARLGLRSTPRYLVYRVAVEVFWRLPGLLQYESPAQIDLEWDQLRALLPARPLGASDRPSGWRDLVRDVTWNYKQYLIGTWS